MTLPGNVSAITLMKIPLMYEYIKFVNTKTNVRVHLKIPLALILKIKRGAHQLQNTKMYPTIIFEWNNQSITDLRWGGATTTNYVNYSQFFNVSSSVSFKNP